LATDAIARVLGAVDRRSIFRCGVSLASQPTRT
jgi:hypothetical protein